MEVRGAGETSHPWGHRTQARVARQPLGLRRLTATAGRVAIAALVVSVPLIVIWGLLRQTYSTYLWDFNGDLYSAGRDLLAGHSPYRPEYWQHLAALRRAGLLHQDAGPIPAKPAPILLLFLPLSVVSAHVGGACFIGLSALALAVALRFLGVADWRCFIVAFASWPVVYTLWVGNANALVVLGCAVAWRWRHRLWPPTLAIAFIVLLKLFPWVLGLWLIMARRIRVLTLAVLTTVIAAGIGWMLIGFTGLASYPRMLSDISVVLQGTGPSFMSFLLAIGISATTAHAIVLLTAAGLVGVAWWFIRRPGGESRAFGLVVMTALVASPHIWEHYLILLFVPIALVSPGLSALWLVPMLTYLSPYVNDQVAISPQVWPVLPYLFSQAIVIWCLCFRPLRDPTVRPAAGIALSSEFRLSR